MSGASFTESKAYLDHIFHLGRGIIREVLKKLRNECRSKPRFDLLIGICLNPTVFTNVAAEPGELLMGHPHRVQGGA